MATDPAPTVFIQLKKRIQLPLGRVVRLGDIATVLSEPKCEEALRKLEIIHPQKNDGNLMIMDMMKIIPFIQRLFPGAHIEPVGPTVCIIEILPKSKRPSIFLFVLVWLLLFFGSALTIMNFHADVSMLEVQIRIVEMITGTRDENPYLFQIAYSFGIGFGMVVFFNHLFKKKWNEEPTPLEVEMFLYQDNIDQYIIAEEYQKMNSDSEAQKKDGRA